MHQVGLFKIRGHFRQKLVGGYADIDGKAQLTLYAFTDMFSGVLWCLSAVFKGHIGHKAFINTVRSDIRGIAFQKSQHPVATFVIIFVVWLKGTEGRTFF